MPSVPGVRGRHPTWPPDRVLISRVVAIIADALQLVLFPFFVEGFGSVLNDVLDVVVCAVLVWLIGWNPLFLPTFIVEILPFGDMAPTWTIAVFIATRSRNAAPPVKELPSEEGDGPLSQRRIES